MTDGIATVGVGRPGSGEGEPDPGGVDAQAQAEAKATNMAKAAQHLASMIKLSAKIDVRMVRRLPTNVRLGVGASISRQSRLAKRAAEREAKVAEALAMGWRGSGTTIRDYLDESITKLRNEWTVLKGCYDFVVKVMDTKIARNSTSFHAAVLENVHAYEQFSFDLDEAAEAMQAVAKTVTHEDLLEAETASAGLTAEFMALQAIYGDDTDLRRLLAPIHAKLQSLARAMEQAGERQLAKLAVQTDDEGLDDAAIEGGFMVAEQGIKNFERVKEIPVAGEVIEAVGIVMSTGCTFLERQADAANLRRKVRNLKKNKADYADAINKFRTEEGKAKLAKQLADNYIAELRYNLKMLRPLALGGNLLVAAAVEATPAAPAGKIVKVVWPTIESTLVTVVTRIQYAEVRRMTDAAAEESGVMGEFVTNFKEQVKARAKVDVVGCLTDPVGTISASALQAAAATVITYVIDMVPLEPSIEADVGQMYSLIEGDLGRMLSGQ